MSDTVLGAVISLDAFSLFQTVTDISLFPVIYFGSEYSHLFYYISPIILKFFAVSGEGENAMLTKQLFLFRNNELDGTRGTREAVSFSTILKIL